MLTRKDIFPEDHLPSTAELQARGRDLAKIHRVVPGPFLKENAVPSEVVYKRRESAAGRIMQHAQIGFRNLEKSRRAWGEIYETCHRKGVRVDRYGITLDWAMGLPAKERQVAVKGTGILLGRTEDFVRLTEVAPVAPHFGDFIMGFPAAIENTCAALAAGATSIGNLGQYFTFRLPNWDDDIATTEATVSALALLAAQQEEVLIHSNLDDGFAGLFTDLASVLGFVLIEKDVIEGLLGANLSHCWGHHFSDPQRRLAFHLALSAVNPTPGTMVYGNTVSYRGEAGANFASLANYLLVDVIGQTARPSGHAVNPVPVTENSRIPEIDEIIDVQLFAGRLAQQSAATWSRLVDIDKAMTVAEEISANGRRFRDNVMQGLEQAGVDTGDAVEMLLALKRLGPKRIEELWGAGEADKAAPRGRRPAVRAPFVEELDELADRHLDRVTSDLRQRIGGLKPRVIVATSDVHEHGKMALEQVLRQLGAEIVDGGVSTDPQTLARAAVANEAEAVLLSTYNGIALDYYESLKSCLPDGFPVLIGGRLNQVPSGSNSSLPVDVSAELAAGGAIVCREIEDAVPALLAIAGQRRASGRNRHR
jgi:hypothetical protein